MTTQTNPLDSITTALRNLFVPQGFVSVQRGWPTSDFLNVDSNYPCLWVYTLNDEGSYLSSTETVHAVINNSDGLTATVYKEKLRKIYTLQLSVFTKTQADLDNYGWMVENQLILKPQQQIGIPNVETAMFKYKSQNNPIPESNYYQRDLIFDVTARVLDSTTAYLTKQASMNSTYN